MTAPRILAFAGSTRTDSWNKKLIRIAAGGARAAGLEVTLIDLRDYPMPLFDGDLEAQGLPERASAFKRLMLDHAGLLISSPEYNSSVSGVLKNALDWASRKEAGEAPLAAFAGKVAGLVSASPGQFGGMRGLAHLRAILGNIHVLVLPDQVAVPRAPEAFTPEGALKDAKLQASVEKVGGEVAHLLMKLHRPP
ncbi:MAG TPA: NAD(P)H-dependent oxidoreductase [Planctomycetota bacterium]|nr:NAD(P)H-dependent oxidoreductase [Planctomycetota bacterium]